MKNLQNWIIAGVALIILLVGGYFVTSNVNQPEEASTTDTTQDQQVGSQVEVKIDYAGESEKTTEVKTVSVTEGQTAWEAIQSAVGLENIEYQDYGGDLGIFMQSINGVKPPGSKFWLFKVNGMGAEVGVSSYKVQEGDKLEFVISEPSAGQ